MSNYNKKTWVNGVDAANAANLQHIEDGIAAVPGTYFITPYHLVSAVTINSGTTNTYTCTGVGGIPTNATGVHINAAFTSTTIGTFAAFGPHGATLASNSNYPSSPLAQISSSILITFSTIVQIDASGKLDIKAFNGNLGSMDVQIDAYII
jgi:hypothetical protein